MHRSHSISTMFALGAVMALTALSANAQTLLQFNQTSFSFSAPVGSTTTQEQPLFILTSTGASLSYSTSIQQSGLSWLSLSPTVGTAPTAVRVIVNPTGLAQATYTATITVSASGAANSPQNITVILAVGAGAISPLSASPSSLSFTYAAGGPIPNTQNIAVTSTTVASFNVSTTTDSGGNWLSANPATSPTPGTVTVAVNPVGLSQGTYNGRVILSPPGLFGTPLSVPVVLTIAASPELKVSALQPFNFQTGTVTPPPPQNLRLTSTGAELPFSATAATLNGGQWLVLSPVSGVTQADLTVSLSQAVLVGLPIGTYTGTITINTTGASNPVTVVQVTLNVGTAPFLNVTPSSLSFTVQPGGALPQSQNLSIAATATGINFTVSAASATVPNWLSVSPTSGTTAGTVAVSINANAQNLPPGVYNGAVTINAPASSTPTLTIPVTLTVSNTPALIASPAALFFNFQTGHSNPQNQIVTVTSSGIPAQFSVATATAKGGQWLQVSASTGQTPTVLGVSVNPAGLAADTYTGSITLTPAASGAAAVTINVTLTVSNNPLLIVSPSVVTFSLAQGAGFTSQNVSLTSTGDQLNFNATFSTTSGGGNWLFLSPLTGTTPNNLIVYAQPGSLGVGVYTGTITVAATGANSQTIPVTLTITTGATLRIDPASLSFTQTQGGPAAAAQTISLTASGSTPVNFSATATTSSCGNWLTVDPVNGSTPAQLRVTPAALSLVAGTPCSGQITIQAPGVTNSPLNIPVSLNVVAPQTLSALPASLSFNYQVGGPAPPLTVQISSSPSPVNFTLASSTQTGGDWLAVSASGTTTPATLQVSLKTANLTQAGTFNGTITITSPTAGNSPLTIGVTVTVTSAPLPRVTTLRNAASYIPSAVSPGEIVYIEGVNVGPQNLTTLRLNAQGLVDTVLAETRVLFDGVPAPLVYVWFDRLSCIVPYSLAGRVTVRMQVEYRGQLSSPVEFQVTDAAPGLFTLNQQGTGQGAILNQDFSVNGPVSANTRPAAAGSVVMIYATGEGQTTPPGVDGRVNSGSVLPRPLLGVTATIGGRDAEVTYAGAAPFFVSGAMQINVRIPADMPPGNAIPLTVQIGNKISQAGVTLAVQ